MALNTSDNEIQAPRREPGDIKECLSALTQEKMYERGRGMERRQVYESLKRNLKNVRFEDLCRAAEAFGFRFRGGKGSHRVYVRQGVAELLNFQNVGGKAKPYQVRQLLKVIEDHNLLEDEDAI